MYKFRNYISISFLALFIAAQSTVLHHFSHDDASIPCKICLVSQHLQTLDYTPVAVTEVPVTIYVLVIQEPKNEYAFAKAETLSTSYASRPPPVTC
jgi:hypothetical protein